MYSFTKVFKYRDRDIVYERITREFYFVENNRASSVINLTEEQKRRGMEYMFTNNILFKTDVEYRENLCKLWLEEKDEKTKDYLVNLIVKSYK